MKHFSLFLILLIPCFLIAQPYKLEVDWEYTSSNEIDINNILYEDQYGQVSYQDKQYDPNNKNDLYRECRKMNSIIPDAIEALGNITSNDPCFDLITQVKKLITTGNISSALEFIVNKLGVNCLPNDFHLMSSRIRRTEKMYSCGTVKFSDYDITINRSTLAFLDILDDFIVTECNCN